MNVGVVALGFDDVQLSTELICHIEVRFHLVVASEGVGHYTVKPTLKASASRCLADGMSFGYLVWVVDVLPIVIDEELIGFIVVKASLGQGIGHGGLTTTW